ncbi:MAG: DUF72 domain-containing protein [Candidatus Brockarchaeota archaeon]|nr:DUF72 domain-containing protein [Candidatus Brockarchaeota archaeon]MBO3808568.1 DUF72 domain-containing protein [Candidatus Brockarchaeota archaeon]
MGRNIFVGTSGWSYDWNPDGFDWYVNNSGLNSVELNASFYRFPFSSQVYSWSRKTPRGFRWVVKVNRMVTHVYRMGSKAVSVFNRFASLFKPLEGSMDYYLFQLPPFVEPSQNTVRNIERFFAKTGVAEKAAVEWRNSKWFSGEWEEWASSRGLTIVSVDSPDLPRHVFNTTGTVYLRMHGRSSWYSHNYTVEELEEVVLKVLASKPKRIFIFLNNNHYMLNNARMLLKMLREATTPG